jgi:hypothetical protein
MPKPLSLSEKQRRLAEYEENVEKGKKARQQAAEKAYQQMKQRAAAEAKGKLEDLRKQKVAQLELEGEKAAREEAEAIAAAAQQLCNRKSATKTADNTSPHTVISQPTKRQCTSTSTNTNTNTNTTAPGARLVWCEGGTGSRTAASGESYEQQAQREGPATPIEVDASVLDTAVRNGLVLVRQGDAYATDGLNDSAWYHTRTWRDLASRIRVNVDPNTDRVVLAADSEHGLAMVGGGKYNIVLQGTDPHALPQMSEQQSAAAVVRMTRPDPTPHGDYRYENIDATVNEAVCTAFAALNKLSVPLYAIACYEGLSINRTLRYGSACLTKRADMDLFRALEAQRDDFEFGRDCAYAVTDLIYRASRCGIAFFDIKPSNILVCINGTEVDYYLTDFDPQFFVRLPDQYSWHSLMLLNVALLAAHVRNADFGPSVDGWMAAVAPVLAQLIKYRSHYDSGWLFHARALRLEYKLLEAHTPFDMQAYFAMMCTSYFYGDWLQKAARPGPSTRFQWDLRSEEALRPEHMAQKQWPAEWPPAWSGVHKPLIQQLVQFATENVKVLS